MAAGSEMDALVAEKAMGWRFRKDDAGCEEPECGWEFPGGGWAFDEDSWPGVDASYDALPFSSNTAAAFEVVDCVQANHPGWRFSLLGGDGEDLGKGQLLPTTAGSGQWQAEFFGHADPKQNYGQRHGQAYADTRALAICRAALMAIGD